MFRNMFQGQGQDQDQGQGQGQDHEKVRQRSALLQLQMVLALTLTLVLTLELVQDSAGNEIFEKKRKIMFSRIPPLRIPPLSGAKIIWKSYVFISFCAFLLGFLASFNGLLIYF